jgi:thioredoxin-dependent peroxiredoxin
MNRIARAALAALALVMAGLGARAALDREMLARGLEAPGFTLPDQDGKTHRLADYRGRTVVLAFYPADMTPGCTLEARSLRDGMPALRSRGVQVLGISVQDVKSKRQFCDKESLNYTLLADVGGTVADQYGVRAPNGMARRVTFIVDGSGRISDVMDKVDVANHARQVLAALPAAPNALVAIGKPVASFSLPAASDGRLVPLFGDRKQNATVVFFISTQCPVSRGYDARMRALANEFTARGVRFVGVNANAGEPASMVAEHAKSAGFRFAVLKDPDNAVSDRFLAAVTPTAYLMDSRGVLRYHGRIDDSQDAGHVTSHDLMNAIEAVLEGKEPPRTEARAFGCSIKRASRT